MRDFINIITEAQSLPHGITFRAGQELYHGTDDGWNPMTQAIRAPAWFGTLEMASQYAQDGGVAHQFTTNRDLTVIQYGVLRSLISVDDMADDYELNEKCAELGYDGWVDGEQVCILDAANIELVAANVEIEDQDADADFSGSGNDKTFESLLRELNTESASLNIWGNVAQNRLLIKVPYGFSPSDAADALIEKFFALGGKFDVQTGIVLDDYEGNPIADHYGLVRRVRLGDEALFGRAKKKSK